jgi:DNA-binding transcriptional ArsR family regulator
MSTYAITLDNNTDVQGQLKLDLLELKKSALVLRALNHKLRQQILLLINDNKKITVTDIYIKLRLEQSVASQHLSILRKAGFVNTTREGKYIYYSVNTDRIAELSKFMTSLLNAKN